MNWLQITGLVAGIAFAVVYIVLSVIQERPVSLRFWRADWRMAWTLFFLELRIARIKRRQKMQKHNEWVRRQVDEKKREIAELAFKEPHAFLGIDRGEQPR